MKWMKCQLKKREEKKREKEKWRDVLELIKVLQNYCILKSKKTNEEIYIPNCLKLFN